MAGVGYVVKTLKLTIGVASYECSVTNAEVVPTTPTRTTSTACPDGTITAVGNTSWALRVTYNIADDGTDFYGVLADAVGEEAVFEFAIDPDGSYGWSGTVYMVPGTGAFKVNDFATGSVTLPGKGAFTFGSLESS